MAACKNIFRKINEKKQLSEKSLLKKFISKISESDQVTGADYRSISIIFFLNLELINFSNRS